MKHFGWLFLAVLLFSACNKTGVEKPDNLISEDKMVNILYDFALLDGIKGSDPSAMAKNHIDPQYIYKKYKIDSVQFAKSDRYYAADVKRYASLYDRVAKKLEARKKQADAYLQSHPEPVKLPEQNSDAMREQAKTKKILSQKSLGK